mmetsp:Transcript_5713/g.8657  ORF Transcript_5713/g.8657 Transcript_5713/m.8657 type:complete len:257 (+) Transcript_5713:116-886(+)
MGRISALVEPSAPPLLDDSPVIVGSAPSATPYYQQTATAEFVEAASQGQTIYIRAVYRTMLHRISLFVNFLTILAAVGLAVGQIWGMAIKNMVIMETVLRSYIIGVAGMIVLNELESVTLLQNSPILYKYPWRGLFYTFMGALGTLLNDLGNDDYANNWNGNRYNNNYNSGYVTFQIPSLEHGIEMFIGITARLLFCMGCVYFIIGCMFLQKRVERDVEAFRHRLRLCNQNFGGEEDVLQRRIGGRLGEELGMTHV